MTRILAWIAVGMMLLTAGCAPAVVGAGAAGAVKVGTDERSVNQQWNDTTITTQVNGALLQDPHVSSMKIDVDTVERHVYLGGVVGTLEEKNRAAEIAASIAGVKSVKNNLQVGSKSIGQYIDDKVIGARVKGRLAENDAVSAINIDVDTNRGVVSLTGIVKSAELKRELVKIVRNTPGVVDVVDNLRISNKP